MIISLPFYSLLIFYFIFLIVFAFFSAVNVYHLVTSGTFTLSSLTITFFIGALTVFTLYFTFILLLDVDWQQTLTLFDTSWFSNLLPN